MAVVFRDAVDLRRTAAKIRDEQQGDTFMEGVATLLVRVAEHLDQAMERQPDRAHQLRAQVPTHVFIPVDMAVDIAHAYDQEG